MAFLAVYGLGALGIFALMTVLWLVSLRLKNASIVDIFWGAGFVLSNWLYLALTPDGAPARKWLAAALVTIWGLRLSLYVLWRNAGKGEDFRYRKWRDENSGVWWWKSYLKVFLLQGLLMWLISAPLLAIQIGRSEGLIWLDYVAVVVWAVGFFFEAAGDWQMARFRANPSNKGKVLDRGVWRYTRHPNYFGDSAQWWGYYLLAVAAGGWWTLWAPLIMTGLLLRVSGVALLEKTLKETKPGYKEYIEATNAFVPWFPKKKAAGTRQGGG
jgi:steroid 5-alpha reductase family enzyme